MKCIYMIRANTAIYKRCNLFYENNYEELTRVVIDTSNNYNQKEAFIPTTDPFRCRFCNKKQGEVSFSNKAHVLPEFFGNSFLFSKFECDTCNKFFGETYDATLGSYFHLNNTLTAVKGKKGFPSYETKSSDLKINLDKDLGLTVAIKRGSPHIQVFPLSKTLHIRYKRKDYIPKYLHKGFVKIALSLLPDNEIDNFKETISWIRNPISDLSHTVNFQSFAFKSDTFHFENRTFFSLFKRKSLNSPIPYLIFLLNHAGSFFLTYIPSIKMDKVNRRLVFFPFPIEPNFVLPIYMNLNSNSKEKFDIATSGIEYFDRDVVRDLLDKEIIEIAY